MPVADAVKKMLRKLQGAVYSKQKRMVDSLEGKYIRRNGTEYLVVSIGDKVTVISAAGTQLRQVQAMSTKAFLGKRIEIL